MLGISSPVCCWYKTKIDGKLQRHKFWKKRKHFDEWVRKGEKDERETDIKTATSASSASSFVRDRNRRSLEPKSCQRNALTHSTHVHTHTCSTFQLLVSHTSERTFHMFYSIRGATKTHNCKRHLGWTATTRGRISAPWLSHINTQTHSHTHSHTCIPAWQGQWTSGECSANEGAVGCKRRVASNDDAISVWQGHLTHGICRRTARDQVDTLFSCPR